MARAKVTVKATGKRLPDGGFPLAIFERHEAHEGGELFIADEKTHEVVMTPGVAKALNDGRLKDVNSYDDDEDTSGAPDSRQLGAGSGDGDTEAEIEALVEDNTADQLKKMADDAGVDYASTATKAEIARAIVEAK